MILELLELVYIISRLLQLHPSMTCCRAGLQILSRDLVLFLFDPFHPLNILIELLIHLQQELDLLHLVHAIFIGVIVVNPRSSQVILITMLHQRRCVVLHIMGNPTKRR